MFPIHLLMYIYVYAITMYRTYLSVHDINYVVMFIFSMETEYRQ